MTSLSSCAPVISLNMGPERGSWQPVSESAASTTMAIAALRRRLGAGTFICIKTLTFKTQEE
ncbi:hypothetical protein D3C73_1422070 [compost metagenome]